MPDLSGLFDDLTTEADIDLVFIELGPAIYALCALMLIMVAAFAAYAFSWMSFPGRNILFVVVVGLPLAAASAA